MFNEEERLQVFQASVVCQNNILIQLNQERNLDLKETNRLLQELLSKIGGLND